MGVFMSKKEKFDMHELAISLLSVARFYASILSKTAKIETKKVPTAGIGFNKYGKLTLYYNSDYLMNQTFESAQAVLVHEVLHVFWRHVMSRLAMNKDDMQLKNIAYDMAINQYVPNLPEGCFYPETFDLPRDEIAEFYYDELKKIREEQKQKQQGQGQGQEGEDQEGDGQGQPQFGDGKGQLVDSHDMWDKVVDKDENGDDQVKSVKDYDIDPDFEAQNVVEKSIKECKDDYGKIPANVLKEIEKIKHPEQRADWKAQMRVFVNSVLSTAKRLSQKRVNRRLLGHVDYIMPGKKKSRRPQLMVYLDSSGSCWDDQTQADFKNELLQINKFATIYFAYVDTKVHTIHKVKTMADMEQEVEGGGGTCFIEAFEIAKKKNVDGVIYMTDTYGSFPEAKDIGKLAQKTIWMTIDQEQVDIPFGKHLNITTDA